MLLFSFLIKKHPGTRASCQKLLKRARCFQKSPGEECEHLLFDVPVGAGENCSLQLHSKHPTEQRCRGEHFYKTRTRGSVYVLTRGNYIIYFKGETGSWGAARDYIFFMSSPLLLDIGSEKVFLSRLEGQTITTPERFLREDRHILLFLEEILRDREFDLVAAATTGLVSGGKVYSKRLGNVDLEDFFRQQYGAELLLINDGHAAARAAAWQGYTKPLLAVHLGTGMAVGIYGEEDLYVGAHGFAGAREKPRGGFFLASLYSDRSGNDKNPEEIFGEKSVLAEEIIEEVAETVAEDILRYTTFIDPATLVLSGGPLLQSLEPRLLRILENREEEELWQQMLSSVLIEISPLGSYTPLLGAATLLASNLDTSEL